jgi:hypothetical protein
MGPVREYIRRKKADGTLKNSRTVASGDVRGLRTADFFGTGRGLKDLESLDDTREEMNARVRSRVHTTSESSEEASSASATESGDEKFRDSAYQDADAARARQHE